MCVLRISGLYTSKLLDAASKKVLNLLKKGLLKVEAMPKSAWTEKDQIDNFLKERRFDTFAGNLVKEILLKLNLPDHSLILTDSKVTPTKHGRITKPYSSPRFIANCFIADSHKDGHGDSEEFMNVFMRIGFGSAIELVSIDESQVVTYNSKFVCGFRNSDCGTGSQSDNTVGSPHGFIIPGFVISKISTKVTEIRTGNGGISTASRLFSNAEELVSIVGASMPVSTAGMLQEVNISIPSPV
ncbi:hypothetical protein Tco_0012065 [Tanacetum coccineum]